MNTAAQRRKTAEQRFMEKVVKSPTGCWQWTGTISRSGYGQFWHKGTNRSAHRVAVELFVGPIPEGLQIDHLCRVRACVNPAHLEPVTCRVNLLRGNTWQSRNAQKTHCPRGHPLSGANLYVNPKGYRVCRECSRQWDKDHPHVPPLETRSCAICATPFTTRYRRTQTCSPSCAGRLISRSKTKH